MKKTSLISTIAARVPFKKAALVAAIGMASTLAQAQFVVGAHTFLSVGIFGRFNVVTAGDFTAKYSDQACGFAAGGDVKLTGGYSVGSAALHADNDPTKKPVGLIIGKSLNWTEASGTILGNVFIGEGANVAISATAPVTLPAPYTVLPITSGVALLALDPEMWIGYAGNTVNQTLGHDNFKSVTITSSGVQTNALPLVFKTAFDGYFSYMTSKARVQAANGLTTVETHGGGKNIVLDGRNLTLKDMPGNALPDGSLNPKKPGAMQTVYIFDVNAADLSDARYVGLRNAPATDDSLLKIGQSMNGKGLPDPTWTLIRVKANGKDTVTLSQMGMQDFSSRTRNTMWMFDDEIKTINLSAVAIEGTIVAPKAKVIANNGHINGTIIADSFEGTLEGHCSPFANYLDPLPSTN
jgi:choice-of-anchor A domain-containing protein